MRRLLCSAKSKKSERIWTHDFTVFRLAAGSLSAFYDIELKNCTLRNIYILASIKIQSISSLYRHLLCISFCNTFITFGSRLVQLKKIWFDKTVKFQRWSSLRDWIVLMQRRPNYFVTRVVTLFFAGIVKYVLVAKMHLFQINQSPVPIDQSITRPDQSITRPDQSINSLDQ